MKKNLSLLILTFSFLILLTACTKKTTDPSGVSPTGLPWNTTQSVENELLQDETQESIEETVVYTVQTWDRWEKVWEDIRVYDENGDEVLSLVDNDEAQYFFATKWKYLILDNGTSASQRLIQIYDISKSEKVFETDYYPWETDIMLEWNTVKYYQRIDNSKLSTYPELAICENEYDNGYIELYWYELWKKATSLWTIKCAYFE